MKSIRFYLIVALLSTVTLGNFAAAVHGYRSSMQEVQVLLDTQLADTAALLEAMRPHSGALTEQPSERLAFQIWSSGGDLILRSANTDESPISVFSAGYRDANFKGHRWRVLSHLQESPQRWILVAERTDIRIELADRIILKSVMPIVLSLPFIGAIVWLVVGNGLALIRKLARELGEKRADDLAPLQTRDPPVELAPVVDAVNDLLRRLEDSVKRERRFSADAAHELRTPLSAIKVHVHNLKIDHPEAAEELHVLDRDLGRLGHLIEQIMLLYRVTPEHYQARMQDVELHGLIQGVIGELFEGIDKKHQNIALVGGAQVIAGDETSLAIMFRNLILNASKYSPEGASIQVIVDRSKDGVRVGVTDTGPGIPASDLDRVFDRFYRVGGDRHPSNNDGCGLGLSIVSYIAQLHHARIELANNDSGPGLTARVTFPDQRAAAGEKRSGSA